jgi:cation diffusion facilitator family transporter
MSSTEPANSTSTTAPAVLPVHLVWIGIAGSIVLAAVKVVTGIIGHSQALIADGIESITDVVSSLAVLTGMSFARRPPDDDHPWGHGKHETFAALFVSLALLMAVGFISYQSILDILRPHETPAWYTLPVLIGVVGIKVALSYALNRAGRRHNSTALQADAWHHLSDAITSTAAFVGICIALVGGPGWESADDWAALLACIIIAYNAVIIGHGALHELGEAMVDPETELKLRRVAAAVDRVRGVEKLRARRSGRGILMDIHVEVDGNLTVAEGHHIAGCVKYALLRSDLRVADVLVHIEPSTPDNH